MMIIITNFQNKDAIMNGINLNYRPLRSRICKLPLFMPYFNICFQVLYPFDLVVWIMRLNKKQLFVVLAYQIAALLGFYIRQSACQFQAVYSHIMIKTLSKIKRCLRLPILNNYNSNIVYNNTVQTMKNKKMNNQIVNAYDKSQNLWRVHRIMRSRQKQLWAENLCDGC